MQNSHCKIVLVFTLLQLVVLLVFGYTPYPDSNGYITLAKDCILYGEPYPISHQLNELPFIWNIGAINFVALTLKIFNSITPLLILYCLLKGATAWLIYQITKNLLNQKTAFIALILYVVYPANYGESTSLLSEIPSLFLFLLGLWLTVCKKKAIAGGGAIAFANWFRPMGIVFLLVLFLYNRKSFLRNIIGYAAVIMIIGGTCFMRTGHFVYQAKTGWMALLQYSVDHTESSDDDALPIIQNTNAIEKDQIWRRRFFSWLKDHPSEYITQMPRKLINTYVSDNVNLCAFLSHKTQRNYLYEELSMKTLYHQFPKYSPVQILAIINLIYYYFLLLSFIIGSVFLVRLKIWKRAVIPFAIIVMTTALIVFVGHGEARFHNILMPFFIMVIAFATTQYQNKKA
jgi:hypothetical protein